MTSLQAHLLIASPKLPEPFTRAVVLLVRHNEEGALGLILNRSTTASMQDAWSKVSDIPCQRDEAIFLGGPCEGPLVALHTDEFLLEIEVLPGLYFCAGKDKLETLAAREEAGPVKFFAGYSGWSPGQLEDEIRRGSWSIMPAQMEHVFAFEEELWPHMCRQVADASLRGRLGIKHMPPDVRMN
ncbi:MAG: YqgE/AlgH family protein [Pirellulales bacterium]